MGVERAVTRWYAQRQLILQNIEALEAMLAQRDAQVAEGVSVEDELSTQRVLLKAQEELRTLGPCPKPMMG